MDVAELAAVLATNEFAAIESGATTIDVSSTSTTTARTKPSSVNDEWKRERYTTVVSDEFFRPYAHYYDDESTATTRAQNNHTT